MEEREFTSQKRVLPSRPDGGPESARGQPARFGKSPIVAHRHLCLDSIDGTHLGVSPSMEMEQRREGVTTSSSRCPSPVGVSGQLAPHNYLVARSRDGQQGVQSPILPLRGARLASNVEGAILASAADAEAMQTSETLTAILPPEMLPAEVANEPCKRTFRNSLPWGPRTGGLGGPASGDIDESHGRSMRKSRTRRFRTGILEHHVQGAGRFPRDVDATKGMRCFEVALHGDSAGSPPQMGVEREVSAHTPVAWGRGWSEMCEESLQARYWTVGNEEGEAVWQHTRAHGRQASAGRHFGIP